ncbi:hypothetical protein P7M32_10870, partial [Bisgaard Taxon 10/6]
QFDFRIGLGFKIILRQQWNSLDGFFLHGAIRAAENPPAFLRRFMLDACFVFIPDQLVKFCFLAEIFSLNKGRG